MQCKLRGKGSQLLHRKTAKEKVNPPRGVLGISTEEKKRGRKKTNTGRLFFLYRLFQLFLHLTGALRDPPAPRRGVSGVEPAPVTSLGSRSPTRPTPVKPQPRPLRDALPVAHEPGTVSARRRHPAEVGDRRDPGDPRRRSYRQPGPAEMRPASPPRCARRPRALPFPSLRPAAAALLTWPGAALRVRCPARGRPPEAAAAVAGARRPRLCAGLWAA